MRLLLLACLALLAACGGEPAAKLNLGDAAPAFRTQRLDGGTVDFPAAASGRPLVIRFWADWCRYCEPEMKAIEVVYRRHKDKGLEVFAVNAGQDQPAVAAFIKKLGVTYPVLLDESASIAKRYGVVGLPTTYFVDAKGVVRGKVIGEADEAVFERHALELLK
ncbi:MAG: TlpA disulfide reductase family protein [Denitratisoma sp.]|nr:TlpA disulfide reductase family protein [Denitratisoma sp.]